MKVLICGIGGRMGKEVAALSSAGYRGAEAYCGFDIAPGENVWDIPVFSEWDKVERRADVIVDFSNHAGTKALLDYAVKAGVPTVVATTGHTEDEMAAIKAAAEKIPVFHSANMSVGVALLCELAKATARAFPDADIEIIEKHHNRKLDAPSGTALLLANAIRTVREDSELVFGRYGHAKRTVGEIGIHAVRMGNVVGEHEILVSTDTQTITLKHEAHSRTLFAEGALAAAEYLVGKPAGLYDMNSIIAD